ncbi:metallophosphoesterase [Aquiflexum sp. LQ15W]|uniref:metallophosphoesterase n=1 Tax=Cognataquiflexum nitidum TaxID=2922272 RepID=UPI001F13658A|nr:metallophosphoesterase [Cognataquiflexum nitidum]MCH6198920.1 metallophosphoesterase [Cognataquiflexum nitidum]
MKNKIPKLYVILLFVYFGLGRFLVIGQDSNLKEKLSLDAVNFIVLGDWGRMGDDFQIPVAAQMAKTAKEIHAQFFISVGDNFYPKGVASTLDPQWRYSFEDIYKDFSLHREWYSILGNHDYMGNPDAQVEYTKISRRWVMPGRYFEKDILLKDRNKSVMQLLFIDTNPLIPEFYKNKEYGPNVMTQDTTLQQIWIDQSLAREDVQWKIVIGHHPMFTGSKARREGYDTRSIRSSLKTKFEKNKVDMYIAGHDHSLQHLISETGIHHFVSGSASEATDVDMLPMSKFAKDEYGFFVFSATAQEIRVFAISHTGEILYQTTIDKK